MYKLVFVIIAAFAASAQGLDLAGVDPNTLSCDPSGQVFLLLPSFTDCNEFFMCVHGEESSMTCPPSTIFDFELQTCNHEWATECRLRTAPTEATEEPTTTTAVPSPVEPEELTEVDGSGDVEDIWEGSGDDGGLSSGDWEFDPSGSKVPATIFKAIIDCSRPRSAASRLPYKDDCQRYWRCVAGLPQAAYCSDGLFFNADSMQCDFEGNVKCDVTHEHELEGEYIVYK